MPDFRSALYLGLRHAARTLRPWAQLTSGVPWALQTSPEARAIAARLAAIAGCEAGLLAPSTLHLFFDLPAIAGQDAVLLERGTYPIGGWGAARVGAVRVFDQHDVGSLHAALLATAPERRPLIVLDGLAPGDRGVGPLGAYSRLASRYGARLVIDDTQAFGILGSRPDPAHPYGHGGGGSLRLHDIAGPHIILIASLAKGLGVPLALLAGARSELDRYAAQSATQMHSSGPSTAALRAAERALAVNHREGAARRARLARLVQLFRSQLQKAGIPVAGGIFPVQTLPAMDARRTLALHTQLARRDVHVIAQRLAHGQGRLCFVLNARHTPHDVISAAAAVTQLLAPQTIAA